MSKPIDMKHMSKNVTSPFGSLLHRIILDTKKINDVRTVKSGKRISGRFPYGTRISTVMIAMVVPHVQSQAN